MSEIEGARGAFELWLRRENGKWADKITERHADGRYCTLQAYMDWGAFQAGWLAALTSIDPDAIRLECADRAERWFYNTIASIEAIELEGFLKPLRAKQIATLRAAILADEPKERGAGDMIEARVWENGEWRIEASSREAYKIDPRASFILVPVMSRAEVERKLKEAEI